MEIQFTREEILSAIKRIDDNPSLRTGRHSSTYDLIYNEQTYPPILVLSLANKLKHGKDLKLLDFENNIDIPFKILREQGFEIKAKLEQKKMNYKQQYKGWAETALKIEDSTKQQYVNSIENLSRIVKYNIFEVDDINTITNLYEDLLKNQKIVNGKYYEKERSSKSLKGWYSASVKTYLDFLKSKEKGGSLKPTNSTSEFNHQKFIQDTRKGGLYYLDQLITRFISSLTTKPFLILTGLSGSGKTKLAQSFAQWICENKDQYCIVPVGADWTNREPLLGYVNALNDREYIKPENGALTLILEANNNLHKPYFLILDEMNLSHVERYFADFLSIMESKENFKLHNDAVNPKSDIPHELSWPNNLFVVGTVNIDETTYMFSPKVLDRANVIEFRVNENEIKNFLESAKDITAIDGLGKTMGASFVEIAEEKPSHGNLENLNKELLNFFNDLQKLGAEFGYRTGSEIQTLFSKIDVINPDYADKEDEKIDIAIMQKLLPKLHGSRRKLIKTLELLAQKCLIMDAGKIFNEKGESLILPDNIKYKLSFEKISRMYKNIIENGFTSYAEA